MQKMYLLIILGLIIISGNLFSQDDTLRYWSPGQVTNIPNAVVQYAMFYPDKPCFIKQITVHFFGTAGKATVVLLGNEADSYLPEASIYTSFKNALAVWQDFNVSTQQGTTTPMNLTITNPVWMPHNRFYICVLNLGAGLYLATDEVAATPTCEYQIGTNKFDYYYQVLFDPVTPQWLYGNHHYAIDVIVNYPSQSQTPHLVDVTSQVGLPTDMPNNSSAWADINGDGYQDLLCSGRLFINNNGHFTEMTSQAGLSGNAGANAFVDLNNDGFLDILLLQSTGGMSEAYINDGSMHFTKKILAINKLTSVSSFSIADLNGDNFPDIFIGQYWATVGTPDRNYLYYNNQNGDFVLQQNICTTSSARPTLGSQFVDFDNDGDLDLYVSNYNDEEDEFYKNDNGVFTNIISQKGIDKNNDPDTQKNHDNGTGVDWFDYNNDGNMDLLLPQFNPSAYLAKDHRGTTIYQNTGAPNFNFQDTYDPLTYTSNVGIDMEETAAGAAWGDPNNDGLADFVLTAYYGCRYVTFYEQQSDHTFKIKTWDYQLDGISTFQDACWVDFNNDGKVDLCMSNNGYFRLFQNEMSSIYHWIEFDLQRADSMKLNIPGTRVRVTCGSDVYTQEVSCGRGQKMQKPFRLHFGLGTHQNIDKIEVRWYGSTQWEEFSSETNTIVTLLEGKGSQYQLPTAPALTYPDNQATGVPLKNNFNWDASQGADSYRLQISLYSSFYPILIDTIISSTSFPLSGLSNYVTYFWRVKAHNLAGWSDWSTSREFETEEFSSVKELSGNADEYYLKENVPNPFSHFSNIEFGLPSSQFVTLKIYNQMGMLITEKVSEHLSPGIYTVSIDAALMPNGIYYYQLSAGDFKATKKFVIVK